MHASDLGNTVDCWTAAMPPLDHLLWRLYKLRVPKEPWTFWYLVGSNRFVIHGTSANPKYEQNHFPTSNKKSYDMYATIIYRFQFNVTSKRYAVDNPFTNSPAPSRQEFVMIILLLVWSYDCPEENSACMQDKNKIVYVLLHGWCPKKRHGLGMQPT